MGTPSRSQLGTTVDLQNRDPDIPFRGAGA